MVELYPREWDQDEPEMCLNCDVDPCDEPCEKYNKKYGVTSK